MAAYTPSMGSPQIHHQQYNGPTALPHRRHTGISKQRFVGELSQCLFDFVIQLLPTAEEMAVKEDVRKLLERLIHTIEPNSRLLSFGSTANGFSLRNSDMDLCCLIDSDERLAASDLVTMLGDLLERETKFHVKPLPHARIPIVKLSLDPSPGLPLGIACDIGFENRLALENTRLLMCYAMIDPTRVRTMVLFLKVWSKRRKINSPYLGTLSSYGYVLLVIYFLVHVKNPPVLPNLQQMPPLRPISKEDTHLGGHNTWFFDDVDLLRQRWQSSNMESVAELLIDFFRYFSRDFSYNTGVASTRAGLLKKESKGWQNELSGGRFNDARERNRLCIEDPFETDFNVARCVSKDGLYLIRGEFMRASRILASRPERAVVALAQLCEERPESEVALASPPPSVYIPPRLSPLPPQTPYTVGNNSMRAKGVPPPERLSPQPKFFEPGSRLSTVQAVPSRSPPEHMAPKRSKWTSPPPPEAPLEDVSSFEDQLGLGLELATSSTDAREKEKAYLSSSSNSEILTDEDHRSDTAESDDVRSVRSFTDSASTSPPESFRRPPWLLTHTVAARTGQTHSALSEEARAKLANRGRLASRLADKVNDAPPTLPSSGPNHDIPALSSKADASRRSLSGPPRMSNGYSLASGVPIALLTPLPPSPNNDLASNSPDSSTVFYETAGPSRPLVYSSSASRSIYPQYPPIYVAGSGVSIYNTLTEHHLPINSPRAMVPSDIGTPSACPDTPTPASFSSHSHSHSTASTVTASTPLANISQFSTSIVGNHSPTSTSPSRSPTLSHVTREQHSLSRASGSVSPLASASPGSNSPTPSSTGYCTSMSLSPSSSPTSTSPSSPQHKVDFPACAPTLGMLHSKGSKLNHHLCSERLDSPSLVSSLQRTSPRVDVVDVDELVAAAANISIECP